jgi:hypothetical protein
LPQPVVWAGCQQVWAGHCHRGRQRRQRSALSHCAFFFVHVVKDCGPPIPSLFAPAMRLCATRAPSVRCLRASAAARSRGGIAAARGPLARCFRLRRRSGTRRSRRRCHSSPLTQCEPPRAEGTRCADRSGAARRRLPPKGRAARSGGCAAAFLQPPHDRVRRPRRSRCPRPTAAQTPCRS